MIIHTYGLDYIETCVKKCKMIKKLHLFDIEIKEEVLNENLEDLLFFVDKCKTLTSLVLHNCNIGSECIDVLSKFIKHNASIVHFDLSSNPLVMTDDFVKAIHGNVYIRRISFYLLRSSTPIDVGRIIDSIIERNAAFLRCTMLSCARAYDSTSDLFETSFQKEIFQTMLIEAYGKDLIKAWVTGDISHYKIQGVSQQ